MVRKFNLLLVCSDTPVNICFFFVLETSSLGSLRMVSLSLKTEPSGLTSSQFLLLLSSCSTFSEIFFSFIFSALLLNFSFLLSYFQFPGAFSCSPSVLLYIEHCSCCLEFSICCPLSWSFLSAALVMTPSLFLYILVSVSWLRGFPHIIWWSLVC